MPSAPDDRTAPDLPARPVMDDADFPGNDPETWSLFVHYHRTRERPLRNALIERHMTLAEGLARPYARRGEPFDDLRQVAMLGLLKAVDRFDPDREIPFASFAIPTIRGELRRHFRDRGWTIKVPRRLQELHLELDAIAAKISQEHGRPPTVTEIAEQVGISQMHVSRLLARSLEILASTLEA